MHPFGLVVPPPSLVQAVLRRLHSLTRELDLLRSSPGLEHLERRLLLLDLALNLSEVGAVVALREPRDEIALLDRHALIAVDLRDDSLYRCADVGSFDGEDRKLSRDPQLHPAEEKNGQRDGEEAEELERSADRADPFLRRPDEGRRPLEDPLEGSAPEGPREGSAEHRHEERREEDGADTLVALDQKAAEMKRYQNEDPDGVDPGQQAVDEIDSPLPRVRPRSSWASPPPQAADRGAQVAECLRPEIRDPQGVAQEVVAIELDEGIEVDEEFDP